MQFKNNQQNEAYIELLRSKKARERYRPKEIKILFIAESPPPDDSNRYFYFEDVSEKDSLFLEMMRVLYVGDDIDPKTIRAQKKSLLKQFQQDHFFLLDSCEYPISKNSKSFKEKKIRESLPKLGNNIKQVINIGTKIVLISRAVYSVCLSPLMDQGFDVINSQMIDFPGSGRQKIFRLKMTSLLQEI